jgi:DNA-binding IclR family transcriptional regulator
MNLSTAYERPRFWQTQFFEDNCFPPLQTRSRPKLPDDALTSERYVIPNLRNACRILKLLGRHADGLKAAELARALEIPVTSTLRIMATLHLEGFVRKNHGRFELGPMLIQLGNASLAGVEIRELATPVLERLTGDVDETSHLAIPCDHRALIVAVQDSPHPLRAASRPGFLAEPHCSATGKIFLAYLQDGQLEATFEKGAPEARTSHTITTISGLRQEIAATLQRGYSLDNEEFHPGVRCVAAPVFSSDGAVVAAIGVTASVVRFPKSRVSEMAARVQAAARELSRMLGFDHASA